MACKNTSPYFSSFFWPTPLTSPISSMVRGHLAAMSSRVALVKMM